MALSAPQNQLIKWSKLSKNRPIMAKFWLKAIHILNWAYELILKPIYMK